jgi:protein-disulfide isomerase
MALGNLADVLPSETPTLGDDSAPVLIVEFSDFTCGYCGKFYRETLPQIREEYLNTGKVRFAYRDFPRDERGVGLMAAHAARCAGEQGKFWEMHDRLFDETSRLGQNVIVKIARDLRLNADLFASCMDSQKYVQRIIADRNAGATLGFRGTPGFLLLRTDGTHFKDPVKIPGAAAYAVFQSQIEQLLKIR